ncbi:MAG: alanine racemase [Myxococcota bacterium]
MTPQVRPTSAHVDLVQLATNLRLIRNHLPASPKILAAVKGDAYGHGAARCARALEASGVDWFGVALVEEGRALRAAGIEAPILCLGGVGPLGAEEAIRNRLTPLIGNIEEAISMNTAATDAGLTYPIHIKVDTGMGRLGVPAHLWNHFLDQLADCRNLQVQGIASHLAESETVGGKINTEQQFRKYEEAVAAAKHRGFDTTLNHISNSGAVLQYPNRGSDMVRPGLLLYGYDPGNRIPRIDVKPIMTVKTQVLVVRDLPAGVGVSYGGQYTTTRPCRLATLPVGYADGYPRALSDQAEVLIHGQRAPVRGRVCMDLCMIDVTDVTTPVKAGDDVILLGEQDGNKITAWDLADWAKTIPYEILAGFSERIPRIS